MIQRPHRRSDPGPVLYVDDLHKVIVLLPSRYDRRSPPSRSALVLVLEHQPHRPFTHLVGMPPDASALRHSSALTRPGAVSDPGAIHDGESRRIAGDVLPRRAVGAAVLCARTRCSGALAGTGSPRRSGTPAGRRDCDRTADSVAEPLDAVQSPEPGVPAGCRGSITRFSRETFGGLG
jgi:hypothetical protein